VCRVHEKLRLSFVRLNTLPRDDFADDSKNIIFSPRCIIIYRQFTYTNGFYLHERTAWFSERTIVVDLCGKTKLINTSCSSLHCSILCIHRRFRRTFLFFSKTMLLYFYNLSSFLTYFVFCF